MGTGRKSTSGVVTSDSLATDKKGKPLMKPSNYNYFSLCHTVVSLDMFDCVG